MNKIVGITGGIGSGKSTVAKVFVAMGVPVFFADDVAKDIIDKDVGIINKIKQMFGEDIYLGNLVDRKKLGEIVFNDPQKLQILNSIIHPSVANYFEMWHSLKQDFLFVLRESAIMFETGIYKKNRFNILVTAPEEIKIERIIQRDRISFKQIEGRMNQQWTDQVKLGFADFVILNDNVTPIIPQVLDIYKNLNNFFTNDRLA
jgi:dephospho-CoA kinase